MKNFLLVALLLLSTSISFASEKEKSANRAPAGISTPDDYNSVRNISMLDGGTLYSGFISFEVDGNKYALKLESNGALSPHNQRMFDTILKVMAGEVRLKQIHTLDGKTLTAGDFSYKVVAAVNVSSKP